MVYLEIKDNASQNMSLITCLHAERNIAELYAERGVEAYWIGTLPFQSFCSLSVKAPHSFHDLSTGLSSGDSWQNL